MVKVTNDFEREQRKKDLETIDREEKEQREKEKEQAKKNNNFVQIYRENMAELRWLMNNHAFASSLLFFIIEHMDYKNALACSYSVFEDYFGKSTPTITRAIKVLKDNGFVDVLKMGNSNVYVINSEIAWSSWNTQKKYASFDGNLLVTRKENKDYEYQSQAERFKALRSREDLKK